MKHGALFLAGFFLFFTWSQAASLETATFRIISAQGPVSGASVTLIGAHSKEGSVSYSFEGLLGDFSGPVRTDAAGEARISYPAILDNAHRADQLALKVSCPGYAVAVALVSIKNPAPIQLSHGTEVRLEVGAPPGTHLAAVYPDMKEADTWKSNFITWTWADAKCTSTARVSEGRYVLRAVAVTSDGRTLFSDPVVFIVPPDAERERVVEERVLSQRLTVRDGVPLRGTIDTAVPRPIRNGAVIAMVEAHPKDFAAPLPWTASVDIAPDGTFFFSSLPSGKLHLIALCQGYVSTNKPGEGRFRFPLEFPMDGSPIVVPMEKSGSARVTVLGDDGKPIPEALIFFSPNQQFSSGTSLWGNRTSTLDILRWKMESSEKPFEPKEQFSFHAITDASGTAAVHDLPPLQEVDLRVFRTGYQTSQSKLSILTGQETAVTIKMIPEQKPE